MTFPQNISLCASLVLIQVCIYNASDKVDDPLDSPDEIELTDGWYPIKAVLDKVLRKAVENGKIYVGQKLQIFGAQLDGLSEPLPPLEGLSRRKIKIFGNSTRRARWDAKLGYQRPRCFPFRVSLGSLDGDGGPVSAVDVVVMRKYPLLVMETLPDNSKAVRSQRGEEIAAMQHQERRANLFQKLLDERNRGKKENGNATWIALQLTPKRRI
ncbi:hypothetical protein HK405_015972 [Cladochytrium tenue]|nr:hypothetical protein HK405_015972 [Cladochytrium tenue]